MNDWMKAVRSPIRYRVGNNRFNLKLNSKFITMALSFTFILFVLYLLISNNNKTYDNRKSTEVETFTDGDKVYYAYHMFDDGKSKVYNSVYPLSLPIVKDDSITYKIMAIADLDTSSKIGDTSKFISYLLKGELVLSNDHKKAKINFELKSVELTTQFAYGDRGMELSELIVFNGKLYTCDDRTGIIYEILLDKNVAVPWVILTDGDGTNPKGFKCEWMTIKDRKLYVGGLGKEWTTAKEF